MTLLHIVITCLVTMSFLSCEGKKELDPVSYVKWIENPENGYVKVKDLNQVSFISFYKPASYRAIKSALKSGGIKADSLEKEIYLFSSWNTFTFRIKSTIETHPLEQGNIGKDEYFKKLEYYINAQQDFKLVVNDNDTIACSVYHLERNYGGAPYLDINVAFKRNKNQEGEFTMLFFDRIFSNGLIKFNYQADETKNLPKYVL